MATRTSRMATDKVLLTDVSDDNDENISENDDSNSDLDESVSESESDDASHDKYIPAENDLRVRVRVSLRR